MTPSSDVIGLVLTGGGARGAYQAGALLAIAEITGARKLPFHALTGSSAGSINAAYLASRAHDFGGATRALGDLWCTLRPSDVFRTDALTLMKTATDWTADLGLGGWIGAGRGKALLETAPLRELVTRSLDIEAMHAHIARGHVHGVAVTATNYHTGLGVSFFEGAPATTPWTRVTRMGVRARLSLDHVMASAAIPVFFPAVCLDGEWYADGSIRLSTPLSPAIRMGARRILAIAVRQVRAGVVAPAPGPAMTKDAPRPYPTPADTAGVVLDALFLDALEADVERTTRINQTLSLLAPEMLEQQKTPLVPVEILVLRPSVDPASLVPAALAHFPATVRHLFRGLGASDDAGWDLLSYLAFEGAFTTRLMEVGYEDTVARADEIRAFLSGVTCLAPPSRLSGT
jgi:NTE family protein